MSYRYDKQKKNKQRWYLIGMLFLVLILFTPLSSMLFDLLERPFVHTLETRNEIHEQGGNIFKALFMGQKLAEENESLKQEIARLRLENMQSGSYQEYIDETSLVPAHIIQRGSLGSRDQVTIRFHEDDEVVPGDAVVAFGKLLLGEVEEVYDITARVRLYSHPGETVSGILFPHDVQALTYGYGNGSFVIEVSRHIEVNEGDILYSEEFPGAVIAIVRAIEFDPRDPYKKVILSYPVNLNTIHQVGIQKMP